MSSLPRIILVFSTILLQRFTYISNSKGTCTASDLDSSSANAAADRIALEAPTPAVGKNLALVLSREVC